MLCIKIFIPNKKMNRIRLKSIEAIISTASAAASNQTAFSSGSSGGAAASSVAAASDSSSSLNDKETHEKKPQLLRSEITAKAALTTGKVNLLGHPLQLNLMRGLGAFAKLSGLQNFTIRFFMDPVPLDEDNNASPILEAEEQQQQESKSKSMDKAEEAALKKEQEFLLAYRQFGLPEFDPLAFHPSEHELRKFAIEVIPRLAYHNPHVTFKVIQEQGTANINPTVELKDKLGKDTVLENTDLDARSLLSLLETRFNH